MSTVHAGREHRAGVSLDDMTRNRASSETRNDPEGLIALVGEAWEAFESAPPSRRLVPAMPILFFGDLDEYFSSQLRVLTVGLNPSWHEFPKSSPIVSRHVV